MKKRTLSIVTVLFIVVFCSATFIFAKNDTLQKHQVKRMVKLSIPFIQNKGIVNPEVLFYAKTLTGTALRPLHSSFWKSKKKNYWDR